MQSPDNSQVNVVEIDTSTYEEEPDPPQGTRINGKLYKPGMFLPGIAQNPGGRPKGKTLKQWAREYLASMTDEERIEYLSGLPKGDIWRMAEGNPSEDKNITVRVPKPILGGLTQSPDSLHARIDEQNSEHIGPTVGVEGTVEDEIHTYIGASDPSPHAPNDEG